MDLGSFHHVHVKGDGDCFFHSIAGYMKLDKEYGHTSPKSLSSVRKLRTDCVEWVKQNLDFKTPSGLTLREEIDDFVNDNDKDVTSVLGYLKYMDKSGSYAGQIEIYSMSIPMGRVAHGVTNLLVRIQVWNFK